MSAMGTGNDVSDLIALVGRAKPKDAVSVIVGATWNPKNADAAVAAVAAIGPEAEPHLIQVLSRNRTSPKWVTTLSRMLEAVGTGVCDALKTHEGEGGHALLTKVRLVAAVA